MITIYKPKQGDTASVVADGYDRNFKTIDAAKADAEATAAALAGKADKAEGKDLMTDAEREKLAGIEPGANAYTLPAATASRLGGIKAGDNVTISADGTLSASAAPYELPRASATVLGGVKVGRNLSIDSEGRLNALGGGSASGGGVLVLPYVAPETDSATGGVTNSAAFVAAWGGILSEYLAAPDQYALYMETDGAEGMMLRVPCNMLNMGGDADTVQWLVSGFTVVNVPADAESSVSCKATVVAVVICNAAGEMQSIEMYSSTGFVGADGQPNQLGEANTLVIDLSSVDINDPDQLKAAFEPVVSSLQANIAVRIYVIEAGHAGSQIPAFCSRNSDSIAIWSIMVHNYIAEDPGDNLVASVTRYWCSLADGQLQSVTCKISSGWLATMSMLADMSFDPASDIEDTDKMLVGGRDNNAHSVTARQLSDYVQSQTPYLGENLLLESRGPWIRHSMGDIRALPFSVGFLTQGETYVFSYVDECEAPAYPTFHLLTRNGPDIIQQIQPGLPFVATRADWEYILVRKGNEGGICTVSHLKVERGAKVTSWACAPVEAGPLQPSLDEQVVPGEFWSGFDGTLRPVYIRTFRGNISTLVADKQLIRNVSEARYVSGGLGSDELFVPPYPQHISSASQWGYLVLGNALMIDLADDNWHSSMQYNLTFKYTKS